MRPMSISLPVGPYDWNPDAIPLAVFHERLDAVRAIMRERGLDGLVVHGNMFDHGALAYLSGFTPKLGPAFALVPLAGAPRLLFTGGPGMKPSAALLTWIEDVRAQRQFKTDAAVWLKECSFGEDARFGLWSGSATAYDVAEEVSAALGADRLTDCTDTLDDLMRRKTSLEQNLVKAAASILDATLTRFRQGLMDGHGVRSASLVAEATAYERGAQDVRWLVSMSAGGEPEPLVDAADPKVEPCLVSLGVRHGGYWAEGHATIGSSSVASLQKVADALAHVLGAAKPGVMLGELAKSVADVVRVTVNGVGLTLEEAPRPDSGHCLQTGDIVSFRIDVSGSPENRFVTSALVAITDKGSEPIWSGDGGLAS